MGNKITIVSATKEEIRPLVSYLQTNGEIIKADSFLIHGLTIEILYTGIGVMHTMYTLMDFLQNEAPDGWIQTGIGGAADPLLAIGEVFQITSEGIIGEGAQQQDGHIIDPFKLGWLSENEYPYVDGLLKCPYSTSFSSATGMTSFYSHGEKAVIDRIKKHPHGQIENMEGAPFFYVSLQKHIPFLSIRSISNYVEPRDTTKWNIPSAISNLNASIIALLEHSGFQTEQLFTKLD